MGRSDAAGTEKEECKQTCGVIPTLPDDMQACITKPDTDGLVTIRLQGLMALQRMAKQDEGGCNNPNVFAGSCFNPSIGLNSTGVFFAGGTRTVTGDGHYTSPGPCTWEGVDARFLAPTPDMLKPITKVINGKQTQIPAPTPLDQLWKVQSRYFYDENGEKEILYKISSNPSTPTMAAVAQGYGVTESDYQIAGMRISGPSGIDIGIGPQAGPPPKPVVPEQDTYIFDPQLLPIRVEDFNSIGPDNLFSRGSWEEGSSWLHIEDCDTTTDPVSPRVLLYLRLRGNDKQHFRLYLIVDPVATDSISPGSPGNNGKMDCVPDWVDCDDSGRNCKFGGWSPYGSVYFPVSLPALLNDEVSIAYTNQLKWLPWTDTPDILDKLKGKVARYEIVGNRGVVAGGGETFDIPYLSLLQWSIAPDRGGGNTPATPGHSPTPGVNMCTPDKGTIQLCNRNGGANCNAEFACERCTPGQWWAAYGTHCSTLGSGDVCQWAEKCFPDAATCQTYASKPRSTPYFKTGNGVPSCP